MSMPRLLVVTAHPDDEVLSFGGLIHLTARAEGTVTLVCTTRGEVGEIVGPDLATPETLGALREAELRASCALLQVADLRLLDYRDSGTAGTPTNEHPRAYCRAADDEVVPRLVRIIREVQPAVVATWALHGGYGHPDHVAAGRHATAAFDLAGQPGHPELGPAWTPTALYYAARPPELREEARAELAASGVAVSRPAPPSAEVEAHRPVVTVQLDVLEALETKKSARAAHRTQATPMSQIGRLSPDLQRRFSGTEYFHRARPPLGVGADDDLLPTLLGLRRAVGKP